uniref:Very long-chain fatty acid transport protein n=1 Tax=Gambierdiscus polynesiensis TaxID=439318 RepID=A0A6M5KDU0_9DINO|nr:long chain fatty acid transporter [Gambierdiscus polynesiensis]
MAVAAKTAAAVALGAAGLKVLDSKTGISADLAIARRMMRALPILNKGKSTADASMSDVWEEAVTKWPNNTFVIFEHQRLTFGDMDMLSNQMAHWLLAQGIKRDDVVAMVMENKAEFIAWWLALTKIGAQVALINYAIKQKGLLHCIKVAKSKAVIFDEDTEESVGAIQTELEGVKLLFWGGRPAMSYKQVQTVTHDILLGYPRSGGEFKAMRNGIKMADNFGFIYTSGTTGLPKAANIMHVKFVGMGSMVMASGLGPGDRLYTCLPIFHSAGGGIGVCGCILSGATLVLARKFSNQRFWPDIVSYGCTAFQYIGELGRYLVNYAKEHPEVLSLAHKLKCAMGNGLRPEVWDDFQDGFRIPLVVEFYGATEGNGALMNFCHRGDKASRGAVGRAGPLLNKIMNAKVVKFNVDTEDVIRSSDGLCIECSPGEAGELVFPIVSDDPAKNFKGYTDEKATSKKILTDVFAKGDSWFRTGDLLSKNSLGLFFFADRIGDTFRWKGENCSTMEVSEIVSSFEGIEEANVYGVKVPGVQDGRGCMVAISGPQELQVREKLDALQKLCEKELPRYAQPLFLRFLPNMEITGTFKHQKVQLREQGCDPRVVRDVLYWLSPGSKRYEKFEESDFLALTNGASRL